jgi:hypothetical protein
MLSQKHLTTTEPLVYPGDVGSREVDAVAIKVPALVVFMAGIVFQSRGHIERVSPKVFVITPGVRRSDAMGRGAG